MPSASTAKLEKQASSEAIDPVKQVYKLVENKIRNLQKKKARLDDYREKQKNGITLEPDQKLAILKYEETCQNLLFTQELRDQLGGISAEAEKAKKTKEKKEAYEREKQEVSKVKEILVIQDVLASMGAENVREDFLAGRNKAPKLTEAELQYLDDLFIEVSPKRETEEGQPPFLDQALNAAKHLLNIVEGKDKEIVGTKYSVLKELVEKISNCGYFDQSAVEEIAPQQEEAPVVEQPPAEEHPPPVPEEMAPEPVPSATYQPSGMPVVEPVVAPVVETAGLYISQRPMADVLTNVMGGGPTTFNFIQESELEPEVAVVPAPALPIPTQTFTNANFAPPPVVAPVYPPPQAEVLYAATTQYSPVPPPQPAPIPTPMPVPTQQFENSNSYQTTKPQSGAGDWNDTTEQNNDWAMQVEQSEQNRWNEPTQQSDDWNDTSNDGFQPAGRGGGRGGRGRGGSSDRGRGGPRGGRGGYQNGRGNYGNNQNSRGGGGYYRNNNEGGNNNYYQNGYQSRGDGERGERGGYQSRGDGERGERGGYQSRGDGERGYRGGGERRGGPRGGQQDRGGNRGAPRGNRGGNPRGGPRGTNR